MMGVDRPVFVLGCPRSGTTMLQLMLHAHARIAIPPETRFLLSAYHHRDAYGDLREPGNRRALAEWITAGADTRFGDLGLDPHAVARQIIDGPPTLGSAIGIVLRAYSHRFGKPRWGDKRPAYVQHIDVLLRLFPDAQIVHLIRDGRDCVASLKRMPWWRMGTHHAIATWAQSIDAGRAAARRLPADAYAEIRYEDLVTDPETELRRLCGFLGEEYDPAMTRPYELAGVAVPHWKKWHADTRKTVSGRSVGTWSRLLEPWEAGLCDAVLLDRLLAYGYEPSGAHPPGAHHLAHYAAVAAHRSLATRKRAMLDRRIRAAESQPVASVLAREALV